MRILKPINLFIILTVASILLVCAPVWATNWDDCDHPRFLEKGCGYEGEDGADGKDGKDGKDGIDGKDGRDGKAGKDGKDGKDGEIPTEWLEVTNNTITNNYDIVNKWRHQIRDAAAASAAMQVHLPQDQQSRLSFSMSNVYNTTGVGVGYAYMMDNDRNTAFTMSVGHAGDETAVRGSVGFEFGGSRKIELPKIVVAPAPAPREVASIPTGHVLVDEAEYGELLLVAENSEEVEEHIQQTEHRYTQQQSLIEELREELDEHADDQEEIDRLKQEAAALRKRQEEDDARRQTVLDRYAQKKGDK